MKRTFLVFMVAILMSKLCFSQDLIILRSGEQVRSKILEVSQTEIKYKKFDNQNGPTYLAGKSEIASIIYENGTKDIFASETDSKVIPESGITTQKTEPAAKTTGGKFLLGFSGVLPTGIWPATALTNMGTTSFLKGQGSAVKSYGFGVILQANVSKHFRVFLDMNAYDYNIFLAKKGSDVQTVWTVEESATHWNESGAPQIQYVHNLPTDVHFDMATTGIRLGGKYIFGNGRIRPWAGAAFGFYEWGAHYYNEDKSKSYGDDKGTVTGITFLFGIDIELMQGIILTPFADLASPVATYNMTGLFYPQWDIQYDSHIMGTNRFGLTISFDPHPAAKK